MLFGFLFGIPNLFAHGLLVEVADDIHDSLVLLLRWWPFNGKDTSTLVMYMLPHHVFGMLVSYPMLLSKHYKNPNAQAIGAFSVRI